MPQQGNWWERGTTLIAPPAAPPQPHETVAGMENKARQVEAAQLTKGRDPAELTLEHRAQFGATDSERDAATYGLGLLRAQRNVKRPEMSDQSFLEQLKQRWVSGASGNIGTLASIGLGAMKGAAEVGKLGAQGPGWTAVEQTPGWKAVARNIESVMYAGHALETQETGVSEGDAPFWSMGFARELLRSGVQSAPDMAVQVGVSMLSRSIWPGLVWAGASVGSRAYMDTKTALMGAGMDEEQATKSATLEAMTDAVFTAITSYLPMEKMLPFLSRTKAAETVKTATRSRLSRWLFGSTPVGKAIRAEAGQEATEQIQQELTQDFFQLGAFPGQQDTRLGSWENAGAFLKSVIMAGIVGGMMGGGVHSITSGVEALAKASEERLARRKGGQEETPPGETPPPEDGTPESEPHKPPQPVGPPGDGDFGTALKDVEPLSPDEATEEEATSRQGLERIVRFAMDDESLMPSMVDLAKKEESPSRGDMQAIGLGHLKLGKQKRVAVRDMLRRILANQQEPAEGATEPTAPAEEGEPKQIPIVNGQVETVSGRTVKAPPTNERVITDEDAARFRRRFDKWLIETARDEVKDAGPQRGQDVTWINTLRPGELQIADRNQLVQVIFGRRDIRFVHPAPSPEPEPPKKPEPKPAPAPETKPKPESPAPKPAPAPEPDRRPEPEPEPEPAPEPAERQKARVERAKQMFDLAAQTPEDSRKNPRARWKEAAEEDLPVEEEQSLADAVEAAAIVGGNLVVRSETKKTTRWKVEVKDGKDQPWASNQITYATKEEADAAASDIASRWMALTDWRVVEVQTEEKPDLASEIERLLPPRPRTARTGESMRRQAYSTPPRLASLLGSAVRALLGKRNIESPRVFEPTIGTGMMVANADALNASAVFGFELDPSRAALAAEVVQKLYGNDADNILANADVFDGKSWTRLSKLARSGNGSGRFDVVMANPPFGSFGPLKLGTGDLGAHVEADAKNANAAMSRDLNVAANALSRLDHNGVGALVLPSFGNQGTDVDRAKWYAARGLFWKWLYGRFNVVAAFTLDGKLYSKMGASWPVDVFLIDGRVAAGEEPTSNLALPNKETLPRVETYEEAARLLGVEGAVPVSRVGRPGDGNTDNVDVNDSGDVQPEDTGVSGEPEQSGPTAPSGAPSGGGSKVRGPSNAPRPPADAGGNGPVQDGDNGGRGPVRPPRSTADIDADIKKEMEDLLGGGGDSVTLGMGLGGAGREMAIIGRIAKLYVEKGIAKFRDVVADFAKLMVQLTKSTKDAVNMASKWAKDLYGQMRSQGGKGMDPPMAVVRMTREEIAAHALNAIEGRESQPAPPPAPEPEEGGGPPKVPSDVEQPKPNTETSEPPPVDLNPQDFALPPLPADPESFATDADEDVDVGKQVNETQNEYLPVAEGESGGSLVPRAMAVPTRRALLNLQKREGNLNDYVAKHVGWTREHLDSVALPEQIDAVALAIDAHRKGAALIVGDETGQGKGRVVAIMLAGYAKKNGMIPVFVTAKKKLYSDIVRDFENVLPPEELAGLDVLPTDSDLTGEDALTSPGGVKIKSGTGPNPLNAVLQNFAATGELSLKKRRFKAIVTTYYQLQPTGKLVPGPSGQSGNMTVRQLLLWTAAPRIFWVLDESHVAGGTAASLSENAEAKRIDEGKAPSVAVFAREVLAKSNGVMFSSGTWAKSPVVMSLYMRTSISEAFDGVQSVIGAIHEGGLRLQKVLSAGLARAGQYLRREKDMRDATFHYAEIGGDSIAREGDAVASSMRATNVFSRILQKRLGDVIQAMSDMGERFSPATESITSILFASVAHNFVNQFLAANKVKRIGEMLAAAKQRGEKPVIVMANTMDSFIDSMVADGIVRPGDRADLTMFELAKRYLRRSRTINIKVRENNVLVPSTVYISDEVLASIPVDPDEEGSPSLLDVYRSAERQVDSMKETLSTVDALIIDRALAEARDAGFSIDEITGRKWRRDSDGKLVPRPPHERTPNANDRRIADYQHGRLDALVINSSGSTGLSLHASGNAKESTDNRRRHMFIVQVDLNIDTLMQILGRINRRGQLREVLPHYTIVGTPLPLDRRPTAVLLRKMKSLSANMVGDADTMVAVSGTDYFNGPGDEAAKAALYGNPDLARKMTLVDSQGRPSVGDEDAFKTVTGNMALLSVADQETMWQEIDEEFQALLRVSDDEQYGEPTIDKPPKQFVGVVAVKRTEGARTALGNAANLFVETIPPLKKVHSSEEVMRMVSAEMDRVKTGTVEDYADALAREMNDAGERIIAEATKGSNPNDGSLEALKEKINESRGRFRAAMRHWHIGAFVTVSHSAMPHWHRVAGYVVGYELATPNNGEKVKDSTTANVNRWYAVVASPDPDRPIQYVKAGSIANFVARGTRGASGLGGLEYLVHDDLSPITAEYKRLADKLQKAVVRPRLVIRGNVAKALVALGAKIDLCLVRTPNGGYERVAIVRNRVRPMDIVEAVAGEPEMADMIAMLNDGPGRTSFSFASWGMVDKVGQGSLRVDIGGSAGQSGQAYVRNEALEEAIGRPFVAGGDNNYYAMFPKEKAREVLVAIERVRGDSPTHWVPSNPTTAAEMMRRSGRGDPVILSQVYERLDKATLEGEDPTPEEIEKAMYDEAVSREAGKAARKAAKEQEKKDKGSGPSLAQIGVGVGLAGLWAHALLSGHADMSMMAGLGFFSQMFGAAKNSPPASVLPKAPASQTLASQMPAVRDNTKRNDLGIIGRAAGPINAAVGSGDRRIVSVVEEMIHSSIEHPHRADMQLAEGLRELDKVPNWKHGGFLGKLVEWMDKPATPADVNADPDLSPEEKKAIVYFKRKDEAYRRAIVGKKRQVLRTILRTATFMELYTRLDELLGGAGMPWILEKRTPKSRYFGIRDTLTGKWVSKTDAINTVVREAYPNDWGLPYAHFYHAFFGRNFVKVLYKGMDKYETIGSHDTSAGAAAVAKKWWDSNPSMHGLVEDFLVEPKVVFGDSIVRLSGGAMNRFRSQLKRAARLSGRDVGNAVRGIVGKKANRQKFWGPLLGRTGATGYSTDFMHVWEAYVRGYFRWSYLTEMNRSVTPRIESIKGTKPRWGLHLEDIRDYTISTQPAFWTQAIDDAVSMIPVVGKFAPPDLAPKALSMQRWANYMLLLQSIKQPVVNLLQTAQTLMPLIGVSGMYTAAQDWVADRKLAWRSKLDKGPDRSILGRFGYFNNQGKFHEGAEGQVLPRFTRFIDLLGATEGFNQNFTFVAMYNIAKRRGMSTKAAVRYARVRGQVYTQFAYTKANQPIWMRGPLLKTVFQFQRFGVAAIGEFVNLAQERNVPALTRFLAAQFAFGGLRLFINMVPKIVGVGLMATLMGWLDKELQDEEGTTTAGRLGAKLLMYGIPGPFGVDLSGSIDLMPQFYGDNAYERAGRFLLGAGGSTIVRIGSSLADGSAVGIDHPMLDRLHTLTREARNSMAFVRMMDGMKQWMTTGKVDVTDKSGNLVKTLEGKAAFARALGFRTTDEAYANEFYSTVLELDGMRRDTLAKIRNQWFENGGTWSQSMIDLQSSWNADWPEYPITNDSVQRSIRGAEERRTVERPYRRTPSQKANTAVRSKVMAEPVR